MHENMAPNVFSNLSRLFKNIANNRVQVCALPLKQNSTHTHKNYVHFTNEGSLGREASAPETDSFTQPHFNSDLRSPSIAGPFSEVFVQQGESFSAHFGI